MCGDALFFLWGGKLKMVFLGVREMSKAIRVLIVAVVFIVNGQCFGGYVAFDNGHTYNIDYLIVNNVRIDLSTTVNWFGNARNESPFKVFVRLDSILNVSGGKIENLEAGNNSQVTMTNGYISTIDGRGDYNWITVSGGSVGHLVNNSASHMIISGGQISTAVNSIIYAHDNSLMEISGGAINGEFQLDQNAQVTFEGDNFAIDGVPVAYGQYYASDYASGLITGTLSKGDALSNQFSIYDNASIIFVPEPATLLLLGLGGLILTRKH
jgi:hypothetical protein